MKSVFFLCTLGSALFEIDSSTGWISTTGDLVYDTLDSYSLTVTGTDGAGHTATATVTISVIESTSWT